MKLNMRMRVLGGLAAAALSLFTLPGCTFISDPVSQMRVPQLPADKASLMAAINSSLKALDGTLTRPANDDNRSIFTEDLDQDGVMETLVFYQTKNEAVVNHGMILEKQGDTWVKKLTFDGDGTKLDSVELKDVTGDGKLNIIAGYSRTEDKGVKGMVVYSYSGECWKRF